MTTCFGLILSHWCYKLRNLSDTIFNSSPVEKTNLSDPHNTIYESIVENNLSFLPHTHAPVRSLDVIIPTKSGILDGDWYLRQPDPVRATNPWHKTRNNLNFDLVPWGKQISDMTVNWNEQEEDRILDKLRKVNAKNSPKLSSKRLSNNKRERMRLTNSKKPKNVKVKLIFEMEMEKNRNKSPFSTLNSTKTIDRPKILTRKFTRSLSKSPTAVISSSTTPSTPNTMDSDPWQQDTEAVYVAIKELEKCTSSHWGYFSQRNININEIIKNNQKSKFNSINTVASVKSNKMNEYKKLSAKKNVNRKKAIVTYCFVDNGKYSKHFCTKCKR